MQLFLVTSRVTLVLLALLVVPLMASATSSATANGLDTTSVSLPKLTESLKLEPVNCNLWVNESEVLSGGQVTVYWETAGLNQIIVNGNVVSEDKGQMVIDNITETKTFTLTGSGLGGGTCNTSVTVTCIPPAVPLRCDDFGYDFQIAKFEWSNHAYQQESLTSGYTVTVNGDAEIAHWDADPAVAGVIAKAATSFEEYAGGTSGAVKKSDIGSGQHDISHLAFCGNEKPEVKECKLELHKSVNRDHAVPGESLTYTIEIENVGEADCTGGGVKIHDVVDANLEYLTHTVSENLSAGYVNKSVYSSSDRTLRFNGHDLNPGEKGTITWTGKVNEPHQCGDFEVHNEAKATAKELSNFSKWTYSNKVTTNIDFDCEEPQGATLVAHKIVCSDEADLPNYGTSGPDITAHTAADWVATHPGCQFASGWKFEWAGATATNPDANVTTNPFYGAAGGEWTLFGPTDNNGRAVTQIPASAIADNGNLWFREVLQDGFIPFTYGPDNQTNADSVSAETYCHVDVKNFDNYDRVDGLVADETYHCVSWNAKKISDTPAPSCDFLTANPAEVRLGASTTLTWETTNAAQAFINPDIGEVDVDGSVSVSPEEDTTYVLTAIGAKDKTDDCHFKVKVDKTPDRPVCPFTPDEDTTVFLFNEKLRSDHSLGNSQTDVQSASFAPGLYDIELASWDAYGSRDLVTQPKEQWQLEFLADASQVGLSNAISDLMDNVKSAFLQEEVNNQYRLETAANGVRAVHAAYPDTGSPNSVDPICAAVTKVPDPAPSCDSFTASPSTIVVGSDATLTWETSNATRVVITNGPGEVDEDGSVTVSPLADTVYQLTVFGTNDRTDTCEIPVTVSEDPVPVCKAFTASPTNLPLGGGDVTLNWEVEGATDVTITPRIGDVNLTGSTTDAVTESTTYTLTAVDSNGDEVSCTAPVSVPDPVPFTCANNVTFNASPNSVRRGSDVTLNWNVTGADSVFISQIDATAFSGTETVNPSNDTTYVLTATLDDESIECPASVTVSTGGGGGGSSSPRCELDISDERISLGDEITLTWDTSRAGNLTITDDLGDVVFTTEDLLAPEKEEFFDGSLTLEPTRDTRYTLVAERGSRDRTCRVAVELEDDVVILETREQEPLVAGISLSAVPYTGFEAGPFLTLMFYILLGAWAFFIAYLVVMRKQTPATETSREEIMQRAEQTRPDVFVPSVTTADTPPATVPPNLPVDTPTVGYENVSIDEIGVAAIEDRAHAQKALLSSDAIRYFVSTTEAGVERDAALDQVITEAKKAYPLEDGWIVINESRMQNLCEVCQVKVETPVSAEPVSPTENQVPEGSSSLAEAIVTGNVMAAYELIGKRPMFSLADAAADLDAIYRKRQGEDKSVSALLESETAHLTDEQIKGMITALTSALDGTYTDEASAVKMAIMKAVKAVA